MNSFVLVSGDFTTHGGMDCANYHLARYLADQPGTAVQIVAFHVEEPLAQHPNVTWHRVKKRLNSYSLSERRLNRAGRAVARQMPEARVIVNGGNCAWGDVNWMHYVHAAWDPKSVPSSGWWPMRVRRSLVDRRHLRDEARAIRQAKLVIANSNRTGRDLIERLGIESDRVKTVYYGIEADRFRPAHEDERRATRLKLGLDANVPVIAFIGALGDRRKGFDLLFDAWKMLLVRGNWDAKVLVIGEGNELSHWRSRSSSAGLSDSILFLGFRRDVAEILRACDGLVSPTRYEAYGLGVHEALCCGIPALVSANAGIAERYPADLSDLLIPEPLTAEGVAERVQHWRKHNDGLKSRLVGFSTELRAISWDQMSRRITQLIEGISPLRGMPGRGSAPRRAHKEQYA